MSFVKLGSGGFIASSTLARIGGELVNGRVSWWEFEGRVLDLRLDNLEGERPELRVTHVRPGWKSKAVLFEVSGLKLVESLTAFVRWVRERQQTARAA